MRTIHKAVLRLETINTVSIPRTANILSAGIQDHTPVIWYECDTDDANKERSIYVFGTGHRMPEGLPLRFIGTAHDIDFGLVWHIFE